MNKMLRIVSVLLLLFMFSGCKTDEAQRMFDDAQVFWEEAKYEESVQNFIALTKAFPEHHLVDDSIFWIGNIYQFYLKEPERAIRYYRSLNKRFEDSEYYNSSMQNLAQIYSESVDEDMRRALLIYTKLQKRNPDPEQWAENQFKMGKIYFSLKQGDQCRAELKKMIIKYPNNKLVPQAYYLIGYSFYQDGKIKLAELTYLEAEKKFNYSKKTLSAAISLADIYEERGRLAEAIDTYTKILNRLEKDEYLFEVFENRIVRLKRRFLKTRN